MSAIDRKSEKGLGISLDRRGFLTGISVSLSALSLPTQAAAVQSPSFENGQRAVFQQMPYFNFEHSGESYQAPKGNHSTRKYLAGISQEEFLSRHWFT